MKCKYTSANGRLSFEVEADTQKAIFQKVADLQEVFEADEACGCCGSDHIRFRVRQSESRATGAKCDYYELHCHACGARLSFGQHQSGGTLFVKRKDGDGKPLPNRGWYIWQPGDDEASQGTRSAPSPPASGPKTPQPTRSGSAGATSSAAATSAPADPPPAAATPDDDHAKVMAALRGIRTKEKADEWLAWGAGRPRTMIQRSEQEKAHRAALERIRQASGAAKAAS
jgi:hypothetical protein